jgi:hypothetical protein
LLLEKETRWFPSHLQGTNESSKPTCQRSELDRAQAIHSQDQPLLGGLRGLPDEGTSGRCERDLDTTGVHFGRAPNHEPSRLEAGQHERDRALMRQCALGEVVDRRCRCLGELVQDEKLPPTDSEPSLRRTSRHPQRTDDSAEPVHHGDHIAMR